MTDTSILGAIGNTPVLELTRVIPPGANSAARPAARREIRDRVTKLAFGVRGKAIAHGDVMKRFGFFLSIAIISLFPGTRTAQAQDPAVVNANTVQVRLENDRVRVLEATLRPGDLEKPHKHPGYVTYSLDSGKVRIRTPDGNVRDADITPGSVVFTEPTTHWAENIGTTILRFILVELKPPKEK